MLSTLYASKRCHVSYIYCSRSAEKHYVEAGDWKSAVHMYRGTDAWEDAYRVAQSHGGPNAAKQAI